MGSILATKLYYRLFRRLKNGKLKSAVLQGDHNGKYTPMYYQEAKWTSDPSYNLIKNRGLSVLSENPIDYPNKIGYYWLFPYLNNPKFELWEVEIGQSFSLVDNNHTHLKTDKIKPIKRIHYDK